MQDYPKTLPPTARVGFTVIATYSRVKQVLLIMHMLVVTMFPLVGDGYMACLCTR